MKFLGGNRDYPDDLPTRDIGPDRLIGHSSNHSEIGIPISTPQDNRSRYITNSLSKYRTRWEMLLYFPAANKLLAQALFILSIGMSAVFPLMEKKSLQLTTYQGQTITDRQVHRIMPYHCVINLITGRMAAGLLRVLPPV